MKIVAKPFVDVCAYIIVSTCLLGFGLLAVIAILLLIPSLGWSWELFMVLKKLVYGDTQWDGRLGG